MFNLIRLEFKKFKLAGLSNGMIIANTILLALMIFMGGVSKYEGEVMFQNVTDLVILSQILIMGTYVVYGSVVLAKLTISEYTNKTMQLMFMYPINRKKLLVSKVCIVYLFTTINVLISSVFVLTGLSITDHIIDIIPGVVNFVSVMEAVSVIGASIVMSGFFSILPLYTGMRKKSTASMIGSSFIVVCLACSNIGPAMNLKFYVGKILILGVVAIIGVALTMVNALNNLDSLEAE